MEMSTKDLWIEETWFENHVAEYQTHGDLKVLMWKAPNTGMYHARFVFDGNRMHVTGDIGTASFWFTEKADVFNQSQYNLGYFVEKLEAFKGEKYTFNSENAVEYLKDWRKELDENERDYSEDEMDKLIHLCKTCDSIEEWGEIIHQNSGFISQLDYEYYEWIYDIGNEYSNRLRGYLVALKMAAKQLKSVVAC